MRRWLQVIAVASALVATSCGDADEPRSVSSSSTTSRPVTPGQATPFTLGDVPPGFQLEAAGRGTNRPRWDVEDADEPFTLLTRGDAAVVVSLAAHRGDPGEILWHDVEDQDELEVDGAHAAYGRIVEDAAAGGWIGELVVLRAGDVAVRGRGLRSSAPDLIPFARATRTTSTHARAPVVTPPDGYEVTGSFDTDGAVALRGADVERGSDEVPGPPDGYGVGWLSGAQQLAAIAVPAGSIEPAAARAYGGLFPGGALEVSTEEIDGRPATVLSAPPEGDSNGGVAVFTTTPWGDGLVVLLGGPEPVRTEDVVHAAASVHPLSLREQSALEEQAEGGPGLNPDAGAVEVARGTAGDTEWLLQARTGIEATGSGDLGPDEIKVDPCLKLAGGARVCTSGSSGTATSALHQDPVDGPAGFPSFVIVRVDRTDVVTARVRTVDGATDGELHPISGGRGVAGVVFTDVDHDLAICRGEPQPGSGDPEVFRVDLLDERGAVVGCAGAG